MKIIARESRPFNERVVTHTSITREFGEKLLAELRADPKVYSVLGRTYLLVEDDYVLVDRLRLLTKH